MSCSADELLSLIGSLSESERTKLLKMLGLTEDPAHTSKRPRLNVAQLQESRFHEGLKCPECKGSSVKKNGGFVDRQGDRRQRYLCKDCRKAFGDFTGTPLARIHRPDLWPAMVKELVDGHSLRKTAKALGISLGTAFTWRHKLLGAHNRGQKPTLKGIVEADETFLRESKKGERNLSRRPRRRGAGLSSLHWEPTVDLVCVLVAQDRRGNALAGKVGTTASVTAKPRRDALRKLLGGRIDPTATFCSDGAQVYRKFCKDAGIAYRLVMPYKRLKKKAIYHLNHVNNWHSRFKDAVNHRFKGVASKYLDHYAAWLILCDKVKGLTPALAAKRAIFEVCCG